MKWVAETIPIGLYFLIAVAFFLPVLLSMDSVFLGTFGDISYTLGTSVYLQYNIERGINSTHTPLLNAPFGSYLSQYGNFLFFIIYLALPLAVATSPLVSYNLLIFFSPLLSAIAAYFLARHFIKSRAACFISGLIYGFSPYILTRVIATHIHLSQGAWLALFALALFRFSERKTYFNAFLLALTLTLVGIFSYYYLYFAVIFAAIFYVYKLWGERAKAIAGAKAALRKPGFFLVEQRHWFAAGAIFLTLFAITILPFILTIVSQSETSVNRGALGGRTNVMNAVYVSSWPQHFVTPSVYHPLFREPVSEFLISTLVGMTFIGATVFIGFTALALAIFAAFKQRQNKAVKFFLFAAIAIFILAIGPFVRYIPFFGLTLAVVPAMLVLYSLYAGNTKAAKFFALAFVALLFVPLLYPLIPLVQQPAADLIGLQELKDAPLPEVIEHLEKYNFLPIPMPSLFLFLTVPVFRAFARLAILLMLCIAVLAGFGVQHIIERVRPSRKHLVALLFSALILFEAVNFPPYIATDISQTPPEYKWLASQPGEPIVLEYPIDWMEFYHIFQLHHMKPVMNGFLSGEFKKIRPYILDPTDAKALSILSGLGVEYIITHDSHFIDLIPDSIPNKKVSLIHLPKDESIPFAKELDQSHESIPGIELVKEFEHAKVFRITAEPKSKEYLDRLLE